MNAIERIISAIPAEAGFTEADRADAHKLLLSCVLWALPGGGPSPHGIEELRSLKHGSGRWLDRIRDGINSAALTTNERGFFLGALGMATGLFLSFSIPACESKPLPAPPRPARKRSGRKTTTPAIPRSVRGVSEIVLPPEWRS